MFWNLVRYEFKNVNKWYLALYGAVLAISVLIGAFINSLSQSYNPNNAAYFIFFLVLVFGGLSVTLLIATIFLIIRRFKGSVYDRQGYLTLTLPVSEHQIITAKLFSALVWYILGLVVFILSILIIIFLTPVEKDFTVLYDFISNYISYGWLYALSLFVSSIAWILSIYLSISIGQLFNEYRTAMGILAYIVIAIVIGYVSLFFRIENDFNMMIGTEILRDLFLSAIYYLGTYYILKNKVNLQ